MILHVVGIYKISWIYLNRSTCSQTCLLTWGRTLLMNGFEYQVHIINLLTFLDKNEYLLVFLSRRLCFCGLFLLFNSCPLKMAPITNSEIQKALDIKIDPASPVFCLVRSLATLLSKWVQTDQTVFYYANPKLIKQIAIFLLC